MVLGQGSMVNRAGGIRTHMRSPSGDFKSPAYANFATAPWEYSILSKANVKRSLGSRSTLLALTEQQDEDMCKERFGTLVLRTCTEQSFVTPDG